MGTAAEQAIVARVARWKFLHEQTSGDNEEPAHILEPVATELSAIERALIDAPSISDADIASKIEFAIALDGIGLAAHAGQVRESALADLQMRV